MSRSASLTPRRRHREALKPPRRSANVIANEGGTVSDIDPVPETVKVRWWKKQVSPVHGGLFSAFLLWLILPGLALIVLVLTLGLFAYEKNKAKHHRSA